MSDTERRRAAIVMSAWLLAALALVCWSAVRLVHSHAARMASYLPLWTGAVACACIGAAWLRTVRARAPMPAAGFFVGTILLSLGLGLAASLAHSRWATGRAGFAARDGAVVAAGAAAAILGAAILWRARGARLRVFVFALVPLVILGLVGELAMRAWTAVYRTRAKAYDMRTYAGWMAHPNQNITAELPGFGTVRYTTTRDGFRVFGDTRTTRTKVLVVGDSFTEARSVSDGKAYYHAIADACKDVELFAFGTGAYSTFQEYMVIDRFWDEIKPDLLILQMSENDLTDNDYELQCMVPYKSYKVRPYYVDGQIRWLFPTRARDPWGMMVARSLLLQSVDRRLANLQAREPGFKPYPMSMDDPMVRRACDTTSQVLGLIGRRAAPTPVVAFCSFDLYGLGRGFEAMCASNGIRFVPEVYETVEKARQAGRVVDGRPHDYHWNEAGHRIAGEYLLEYLRREGLLCAAGDAATTAPARDNKHKGDM